MSVLSRTFVPGAVGSSVLARRLTTLFTSWVVNHFCAVANGMRTAVCRLVMLIGELYWAPGAAWYIVCDSVLWWAPGAPAKPKSKSQVAYIGMSPMIGAAAQMSAWATTSS